MKYTIASARQKKWVDMVCGCGCRYSCQVEAEGSASDQTIPFSRETLKDMALNILEEKLRRKAQAFPCPQCGKHADEYLERKLRSARNLVFWGLGIGLFVVLSALLAVVTPKAPAKLLPLVLLGSLVAAFIARGTLAEMLNPDRDLVANRRLAREAISAGEMRREPKAPPAPPAPKP